MGLEWYEGDDLANLKTKEKKKNLFWEIIQKVKLKSKSIVNDKKWCPQAFNVKSDFS